MVKSPPVDGQSWALAATTSGLSQLCIPNLRPKLGFLKNPFLGKFNKSQNIVDWLVVSTILKIMKVNGKDDIPYIMKNKSHV
jgi:hypothetical protein